MAYKTRDPWESTGQWRAEMEHGAWRVGPAMATGAAGYERELDWHCAIQFTLRASYKGAREAMELSALSTISRWRSKSLELAPARQAKAWLSMTRRAAEICCKYLRNQRSRDALGLDPTLSRLLHKACCKDGDWISEAAGQGAPLEMKVGPLSVKPPLALPDWWKNKLHGARLSAALSIFPTEEQAHEALARAESGLKATLGNEIWTVIAPTGQPAWIPEADAWRAMWEASQIRREVKTVGSAPKAKAFSL